MPLGESRPEDDMSPQQSNDRHDRAEGLTGLLGRDMAVDLGTANTLVYVRGKGVVLNEPSVVAINTENKQVLAVGTEAKRMIGRTPAHIQAVRPLKDGVIADFEVTVISMGGIVTATSVRVGGDELDEAIIAYAKKEFSMVLGERTAEALKMAIGSAFPTPDEVIAEIKDTLDRCPPELAADLMDQGILLTGGGAMLRGLHERLRHETGMPVGVAEDPLYCVVLGSGRCLEEFEAMKRVLVSSGRR